MICPECQKLGLKSKVYSLGGTSTMLGFCDFYDEEGKLHSHNPNIKSRGFKCSNEHAWLTTEKDPCPTCGEWWKHEEEIKP